MNKLLLLFWELVTALGLNERLSPDWLLIGKVCNSMSSNRCHHCFMRRNVQRLPPCFDLRSNLGYNIEFLQCMFF